MQDKENRLEAPLELSKTRPYVFSKWVASTIISEI